MTATRQRPLRPLSSATDLTELTDYTNSVLDAEVCLLPLPALLSCSPQRDSGTRS